MAISVCDVTKDVKAALRRDTPSLEGYQLSIFDGKKVNNIECIPWGDAMRLADWIRRTDDSWVGKRRGGFGDASIRRSGMGMQVTVMDGDLEDPESRTVFDHVFGEGFEVSLISGDKDVAIRIRDVSTDSPVAVFHATRVLDRNLNTWTRPLPRRDP